jgi:hypothetical protein
MASADSKTGVRDELVDLIDSQLNTLEKETFGCATKAELCEYEDRRDRICKLYTELIDRETSARLSPPVLRRSWPNIVGKAPKKAAFPEHARLVAAVIFLLLFCVGTFYLAAACIPLALLRDKFIHMADPTTFAAFTPRYYQHLRVTVVLFGVAALFLAALQFRFRHPVTTGIGICIADGYRMVDGIRQWCGEVSTAEWLLLSIITALAGIVRLHYLHQPMRYDEVTTFASYASKPFYVVLSVYAAPNNHVLHTILVRCSYLLFGSQNWALRVPTLVAGMCMVPATYAVTRTLYGQGAAALAAGLVGTSSTMIEYSTFARGYTLICLFSLLLFWLVTFLARNHNWAGWVLLGLLGAFGFYTIPIMLYPYATAVAWLILSSLVGDTTAPPRTIVTGLLVASAVAGFVAFWLYSPIFVISGPRAVFANRWVEPLKTSVFLRNLPPSLASTWRAWNRDWPVALTWILGVGFAISLIWSRRCGRYRIPFPLAILAAVVPLLLAQRVVPFERVWLFALPIFLASASAGLALVVSRADLRTKSSRLVLRISVVLISVWAAVGVWRGNSVYLANEARGLEQTAGFLKADLKPGDSVLTGLWQKRSLTYYLEGAGVSAQFIDAPTSHNVFVVVSEVGSDTLPIILATAKIQPQCAWEAQRMGSFDAVSVYELSSLSPSSSPTSSCTWRAMPH